MPSASGPTSAPTIGVAADSAERERLQRERAAQELRERERECLDAMRREMQVPIYLAFDESRLSDTARGRLEAKVPILASGGSTLRIIIEGHADEAGSDEYNLARAQRRAAAAKQHLVARQIVPMRSEIASYGEERPACTAAGDSCLGLNRRDEFRIIAGSISPRIP